MRAGIVYFTDKGKATCQRIVEALKKQDFQCEIRDKNEPLKEWAKRAFEEMDAVVFVSATGIAVRTIAPLLKSKAEDPAVIVTDDNGIYVISLVSGHIGGANELAVKLAEETEGIPVITTSTDINNKFAVDKWAVDNGLVIKNINRVSDVSMTLVNEGVVGIYGDMKLSVKDPQIKLYVKEEDKIETNIGINISWHKKNRFAKELRLLPKWLTIGIGCRKNTSCQTIEKVVSEVLDEFDIDKEAIVKVASIDIKKEEKGLIEFSQKNNWPFETYSAEKLKSAKGEFPPSSFVEKITGVDNVCQRAAVIGATYQQSSDEASSQAAENQIHGRIIVEKQSKNGVTVAIAAKEAELNVQ